MQNLVYPSRVLPYGASTDAKLDSLLTPLNFLARGGSLDAFGRYRVSNPENIFELVFYRDCLATDEDVTSSVTSGGSVTHNLNKTSYDLSVTTTTGSKAILQSKEYIVYKPGRSQLIKITGTFNASNNSVEIMYGQFDTNNGFYFVRRSGIMYVGIRSKVSGSIVNTEVAQSSWNVDKADGTGDSGITFDFTKQSIFGFDYQWQGSGRVRFFVASGDSVLYLHTFYNSGISTAPYSQTAVLPIRVEITNTGATSATMSVTCWAVDSEGETSPTGQLRSVNNGTTAISYTTIGQRKPIISLRKKSTELSFPLQILEANFFANSVDDFLIELIINGTLTGSSFTANTGVGEYDVSSTVITGGRTIYSNYVRGSSSAGSLVSTAIATFTRTLSLGHTLANVSDIFTIVATNLSSNATALGSINYRDLK